jgi:predicted ATP-grasp superfamily ATP-dependent carboligase
MYNLKIYPYKTGSESATALANLLDVLKVKPDGAYVPKVGHKVVNWGNGRIPNWSRTAEMRGVTILNKPEAVGVASNKLTALQKLQAARVATPEFTTDMLVARQWLRAGKTVVERHELRGNSGEGIRIVNLDDPEMASDLQSAPLYTKFIPKTNEFRVHVFRGEVIDYIEKKKVLPANRPANFNKYISSVNYGWVFSRTDVRDIPEVRAMAIKAVAALGLDFGAVDIVYENGFPFVLEVNTAPGLSGTTLVKYANAFRRYMGQPDLPSTVTGSLLDVVTPTPRVAPVAPLDNTMHEMVTLRIDRGTALKLRSLLASI